MSATARRPRAAPVEERISPMPRPGDWPDRRTSDLDLHSTNAFLTAQTAYQAGRLQQMRREYLQLADEFNNLHRDGAQVRREHGEMKAFIEALSGKGSPQ